MMSKLLVGLLAVSVICTEEPLIQKLLAQPLNGKITNWATATCDDTATGTCIKDFMKDIDYSGVLTGDMGYDNFIYASSKQTTTAAAFGTYCKHVQKRTACIHDYDNCMTGSHLQTALGVDLTAVSYAVHFSIMGNFCKAKNEPTVEKRWTCVNNVLQDGMEKYSEQMEACLEGKVPPDSKDVCKISQAALDCSSEPVKTCGSEIIHVFCEGIIAALKAAGQWNQLPSSCKGNLPTCGGTNSIIHSSFTIVAFLLIILLNGMHGM